MQPENNEVPAQSIAFSPEFVTEYMSRRSTEPSKQQNLMETVRVIFEDVQATVGKNDISITSDGFQHLVPSDVEVTSTPIPIQFEDASPSRTCRSPQAAACGMDHVFASNVRGQPQVMPTLFENPPFSIDQGPSQVIPVKFEDAPTSANEDSSQNIPVKFEDPSTSCEQDTSQVIPIKFEDVSEDAQVVPVTFASTPKRKHKQIGPLHAQTMPVAFTNPSRTVASDCQNDSTTVPVAFESDDEEDSQTTSSECGRHRWSKRGSSFEDFPPSAYLQQKMSMDIDVVNAANLLEELIPLGEELHRSRQHGMLRHRDSHDSQCTSNDGEMLIETVYIDEDEGMDIPVHFEEPSDAMTMRSHTLRESDTNGTLIPVHFEQQSQGSIPPENMQKCDLTECSQLTQITTAMAEPIESSNFGTTVIERKGAECDSFTLNHQNTSELSHCEKKIENAQNEISEEKHKTTFASVEQKEDLHHLIMDEGTPIAVIFEDDNVQEHDGRLPQSIEPRNGEIHIEAKLVSELDDNNVDDVLKSVPSPTVCEQLPSAVVEAVPENVLKFSAAPAVHHSAPHATVESPLQDETSVTKIEVKPIMTSDHPEPEEKHEDHKAEVKEEKHEEHKAEAKEEKHEEHKAEVKEEKHEEHKAEVKEEKHEEHDAEVKEEKHKVHEEGKPQESSAPAPPLPKSPPPVPPKTKSIDMTTKEMEEKALRGEPIETREETTKLQFKSNVKASHEPEPAAAEPEKPKEPEHKPEPPKEHKEEPAPPKEHQPLPPVTSKPEKSEEPLPPVAPKPKEPEKSEQPLPPVAPKPKEPAPAPTVTPPKVEKPKEPEPKKAEHDVGEAIEKKHAAPLTTTTTTTTSTVQPSAAAVPKQEPKKPMAQPSEHIQPSATTTTTTKVEQPTVKESEHHEVETKASTQPQPESQTQSAVSQKVDSAPAEKAEEALVETSKSDTLKSKGGESTNGQQQQQPARRRCTIL